MLVAIISLFDVFGMSIHSAPMTPPLLHPSIIMFRAPFHVMVWVTPAEVLHSGVLHDRFQVLGSGNSRRLEFMASGLVVGIQQ